MITRPFFSIATSCALSIAGVAAVGTNTLSAQDTSSRVVSADLRPPPSAVDIAVLRPGVDSVTARPGADYSAWFLHRLIFGDLNRDAWELAFRVPVLRLDTTFGGLKVVEVSGGKQTLGLRLMGTDSSLYQFRSMVKDPRRAMPKMIHWTPFASIVQDQMAGQFPLAPLIVAELLETADVLVAKPRAFVMANDERLGEYRDVFAGRMGWLEVRPQGAEGDRPGFGGAEKINDSFELYEELLQNPSSYVDIRALLRARYVDFLVGDWDRHSDQWRWARFKDGKRERWAPIPRDRDWAMPHLDGAIRSLVRFYAPWSSFEPEYPKIIYLGWVSQRVDRMLLNGVDRSLFLEVAREMSAKLNDNALTKAVAVLPPSYESYRQPILHALRARRDSLEQAASAFYLLLAEQPDVYASDEADSVVVSASGQDVRLEIHTPTSGGGVLQRFSRTFHAAETKEVRLYLFDGADRVVVAGDNELPITMRIVTGDDDDRIVDQTSGKKLRVYNSDGDDELQLGKKAFSTENNYYMQDSIETAVLQFNRRDWGKGWLPTPALDHEKDLGMLAGLTLSRYRFGFGQERCHSCLSLEWLGAIQAMEWIGRVNYERKISPGGLWLANSFELQSGRPMRFYGFGNDLETASNEGVFTGFRRTSELRTALRYKPASTLHIDAGLSYRRHGVIREGGEIFEQLDYGAGPFQQIGLRTALDFDTRDSRSFPSHGAVVRLSADYHPSLLDVESPYASTRALVRLYHRTSLPLEPAIQLRGIAEKVWGTAPFSDNPWLGGFATLPGFSRAQFRGDAMASGTAVLRLKAFSLMKIDMGVHGLSAIGRVWQPGEESTTWHTSSGYGAWFQLPSIDKTLSVTFAKGDRQRIYFDFGVVF